MNPRRAKGNSGQATRGTTRGRSRAVLQVAAAGGDTGAVTPAPARNGARGSASAPVRRTVAPPSAPAEAQPSGAACEARALPPGYAALQEALGALQTALHLVRGRGGAATLDVVCPVVTSLTGRGCCAELLAQLQAALREGGDQEAGPEGGVAPQRGGALHLSWQRVPRRRGEPPEEQLVVSLACVRPGEAPLSEQLHRKLWSKCLQAQQAGTQPPAIAPAPLPVRPSVRAAEAACQRAADAAAAAAAAAAAGAADADADADDAPLPRASQHKLHRLFGGVGDAGGVSLLALQRTAAAQRDAASDAALAAHRTAARRAAQLPPLFDSLRSWLVGNSRASAPLDELVAALHSGTAAARAAGGKPAQEATEIRAQLVDLVDALPEWAFSEAQLGAPQGRLVLRFNPWADVQPLRRRLADAAKAASARLKEGSSQTSV